MIADLCLVLLLDASGSINSEEWDLQARATADAIASRTVVERIERGPNGRIAVTAMEWAGGQALMLPWTPVASMDDARSVALVLASYQRQHHGSTGVGNALLAAAAALKSGPDCLRHVVDISSDGTSNYGSSPDEAVALLQGMDALVNAIVIEDADEPGTLDYYRRTVSGFVLPATWDSYAQAIKTKLQLEVAGLD